ncbi:MAG: ATP-binding protein [Acidimicrobiales bacterium]|nr:ATP-binding protein [Acidimicrobiales bacterium]
MRKRRLRRRLADAVRDESRARDQITRHARDGVRLRLALEAIPQLLVVWDEHGSVIIRNHHDPHARLPHEASPLLDAAIDELGRLDVRSEPVTRTLELRGPPLRQLVLRTMALSDGPDALGTMAVVDDVSERQKLDAVRRDFVANVSHELRTPIGALTLLGEALSGQTDPAVVSRLAARITAEADRAARMIEDLLDLSRIESAEPPDHRLVDSDAIVAAAIERAAPAAGLKGVRLLSATRRARNVQVLGDEAQLVSAVANLVDNAVKYSDPGSSVKVTAKVIDQALLIEVRDRGIGIPAGDLERIFERFYRVDRARSRGTGGTGLGLSIVHHVATNHGGDVSVESIEGRGSTFTLRLPAAHVAVPAEAVAR